MSHLVRVLLFIIFLTTFLFSGCLDKKTIANKNESSFITESDSTNTISNSKSIDNNENRLNAVIEIPAGSIKKWEQNKTSGKIELEIIDNKPRLIKYLGYPGNYGFIPGTLLSKYRGGDGDPLDVLVLGPPIAKGDTVQSKVIGVLYLSDSGERDDKLIAVSPNSPFYNVNTIEELDSKFQGVTDIIKIWFTNYKGPDLVTSDGFGDSVNAYKIFQLAKREYIDNQ